MNHPTLFKTLHQIQFIIYQSQIITIPDPNWAPNTKTQTSIYCLPETPETSNLGTAEKAEDANAGCNSIVTGYLERKLTYLRTE